MAIYMSTVDIELLQEPKYLLLWSKIFPLPFKDSNSKEFRS